MCRVLNKHHAGMPAGAVYIGRGSKWGNPFRIRFPKYTRHEYFKHHAAEPIVKSLRLTIIASVCFGGALPLSQAGPMEPVQFWRMALSFRCGHILRTPT